MGEPTAIYVTLTWIAVGCYALGTVANVHGVLFQHPRTERGSYLAIGVGMLVHAGAIAWWWRVVGHGPYMAPSEVLSSDAWVALAIFFAFRAAFPRIQPASVVVFPLAMLMLALSVFQNPGIRTLPPTFGSVWLVFHISFYKVALGTLMVALAFSLFLLAKGRSRAAWIARLPDPEKLDLYAYRFTGFGFVFWGIAMLAGSIWAYNSWGRYWGWDPVETWALVTWLLFGIYLHLRRFFRWNGRRAAWLLVGCFLVSLVSVFVTSHMGSSIHAEYFK
jgi:ABC-type transport system involved in cytochrome c biogenesis permease subunit